MRLRIVKVILIVFIISSFIYVPTNAAESTASLSYITDTTSYSQDQYLNLDELSGISAQSNISDDKRIQLTCESFLAIAKAFVRKPTEYNPSVRILSNCLAKDTIQYRLTDYAYKCYSNYYVFMDL